MVDFSKLMSHEQRSSLKAMDAEIDRLSGLTDVWLANALLKMARECRGLFPDRLVDPTTPVYDNAFVWHVIPELASRLGANRLQPNESTRPEIREADDQTLRRLVEYYAENVSMGSWSVDIDIPGFPAHALLSRSAPLGNPAIIAADRILKKACDQGTPDPEEINDDDFDDLAAPKPF